MKVNDTTWQPYLDNGLVVSSCVALLGVDMVYLTSCAVYSSSLLRFLIYECCV